MFRHCGRCFSEGNFGPDENTAVPGVNEPISVLCIQLLVGYKKLLDKIFMPHSAAYEVADDTELTGKLWGTSVRVVVKCLPRS